jgi:hypothetical protein
MALHLLEKRILFASETPKPHLKETVAEKVWRLFEEADQFRARHREADAPGVEFPQQPRTIANSYENITTKPRRTRN